MVPQKLDRKMPVHLPNDGLHPRPWLIGCHFHVLAECRYRSATCPASGVLDPIITTVLGEPGFITEDAVFPLTQCLRSLIWPHSRRRRHCIKTSLGHSAGRRWYPAARSQFITVRQSAVVCLPNRRFFCMLTNPCVTEFSLPYTKNLSALTRQSAAKRAPTNFALRCPQ